MNQFEVITITLSIILGLSMSHLLWSAASAVRARDRLRLHWLPLAWATCIFLQHANFWFAALSIDLSMDGWTWSWYLQMLLLAVLLFAAGALILPSDLQGVEDLRADYQRHGRQALIPFAAYQLLWFPTNYRAGGSTRLADLLNPGNLANFALIALLVIGYRSKKASHQAAAVAVFASVLIWAQAFVWAPGVF